MHVTHSSHPQRDDDVIAGMTYARTPALLSLAIGYLA
jgi:hypothetical protein